LTDFSDCGTASLQENGTLNASSPLIWKKLPTRSIVECTIECWKISPFQCNAVFRDDKGISLTIFKKTENRKTK